MEKEARQFAVKTNDDEIVISQERFGHDEDDLVVITPEQVDLLAQWLQEAKAELLGKGVTAKHTSNGHRP